jgi:hypothetical protein
MQKLNFIFILAIFILTTLFFNGEAFAMELSSSAFLNNSTIPANYTCDKENISPPLAWKDAPIGTRTFALIVDDPDAPRGTWTHWVLYNLPADTMSLAENVKTLPAETKIGINSWGKQEYGGPCPPSGEHRYFFKLFAIDISLESKKPLTSETLTDAMQGHILENVEIIGRYTKHR